MNTDHLMLTAISLSEKALGRTAPNPIVAAIVVDAQGAVIGEGFHNRALSPDHAEVVALKAAGLKAKGATLLVTLEPCNHVGSTPSCAQAIIDAGIAKVVFAVSDPNPIAAGGAKTLTAAGIEVISGVCKEEAAFSNRAWLGKIASKRPYFIWKIASTLDGKVAAVDASSKWITGEAARADVQTLRRQSDAILVGTNTVVVDNPHLVPRGSFDGYAGNPLRVVCGDRELDANSYIFDNAAPTLHVKSKNLSELIAELNQRDINQVLVEAGPTLGSAMLLAGLIDEIVIYLAPSLLGSGKNFIADMGISGIADAAKLELVEVERVGDDIKARYLVKGDR